MSTKTVLATRALRKIGACAAEEAPEAADQAFAESKVQAVHDYLSARGKARWTIADVPNYADEPYVLMAAAWIAPEFGTDPGEMYALGYAMFSQVTATPDAEGATVAVYF